jgi:multidrug efflux pump subunit AcrA (membrane-fusion protein)
MLDTVQTIFEEEHSLELMEGEVLEQTAETPEMEDAVLEEEANVPEKTKSAPQLKKKKRRKKGPIIAGVVVLLLAAFLIWFFVAKKDKEPEAEVLTDVVARGSITSVIEGNGIAKPKNSESISIGTSGTVVDVYVSEGQAVAAGTVLYLIDSPAAQEAATKAQQDVDGYKKQLKSLYEAKQNLNIKAEFSGKILEKADVKKGDQVTNGQLLGRLVDDSKMKLTQYYSYAYENDIHVGQSVQVSVPAAMQQLAGTVSEITKVERISAEGSKLFCVEISIDNPGTLAEKLTASAIISANGEQISPYEMGTLEYNRSMEIKSKVTGEVASTMLQDYLKVSAGQVLMSVDGEDNDNEIFQLEENLKTAQKTLDDANKNKQNLQATAPIDGTVVGLAIAAGDTVAANTAVVSIMDTSQMIVEAAVDERNVSYVTPGMLVEIDQFGNITTGIVESVGLNGKFENGMTTYPAKVMVDNADGMLNNNGSVVYRINASQSDDCLLLPTQCVKSVSDPETGENLSVVYVKSDTAPEGSVDIDGSALGVPETGYYAVPVTIGISDKNNVEILDGLEEGIEVFSQVVKDNTFMAY